MARYIDADALKQNIEQCISEGMRMARRIVELFQTADVVEVVRCKDCKNYRLDRPLSSRDKDNSPYFCCVHDRYLFVDDYCRYGVRKDG